jgi:hypothetical protein
MTIQQILLFGRKWSHIAQFLDPCSPNDVKNEGRRLDQPNYLTEINALLGNHIVMH